eukprot:TRINITY_DN7157_c0_g1_i1.p3 TRINITY_DN7157_c0_g1~~TRINITY_DN7157_c0_g1_i1.p3  ORF type:complete len:136 (+),score=36.97 TRINITY_DN7157_c0_g1_i1:61-468(+)
MCIRDRTQIQKLKEDFFSMKDANDCYDEKQEALRSTSQTSFEEQEEEQRYDVPVPTPICDDRAQITVGATGELEREFEELKKLMKAKKGACKKRTKSYAVGAQMDSILMGLQEDIQKVDFGHEMQFSFGECRNGR